MSCGCQELATLRWHLEQVQVYPDSVKYKDWPDFTGLITDKNAKTSGRLIPSSALEAKNKAIEYCFGSSNPEAVKDRRKNLIIHKHLSSGKNVIIVGGRNTGRSLLACLILKEVIYATSFLNLKLQYKWMKASNILSDARWDNEKPIDHASLDDIAQQHFLVVDDVDVPHGGHNNPPDMVAMNVLFYERKIRQYPHIIVCSDVFWEAASNPARAGHVIKNWGHEFLGVLNNPHNVIIELVKEATRVG